MDDSIHIVSWCLCLLLSLSVDVGLRVRALVNHRMLNTNALRPHSLRNSRRSSRRAETPQSTWRGGGGGVWKEMENHRGTCVSWKNSLRCGRPLAGRGRCSPTELTELQPQHVHKHPATMTPPPCRNRRRVPLNFECLRLFILNILFCLAWHTDRLHCAGNDRRRDGFTVWVGGCRPVCVCVPCSSESYTCDRKPYYDVPIHTHERTPQFTFRMSEQNVRLTIVLGCSNDIDHPVPGLDVLSIVTHRASVTRLRTDLAVGLCTLWGHSDPIIGVKSWPVHARDVLFLMLVWIPIVWLHINK